MNWREIKSVHLSFRIGFSERERAQQVFHRMVRWLYELMGEEAGREFMLMVVDPDPLIDWETGLELGDPCPKHPAETLSSWPIVDSGEVHLECSRCFR